MKKIVIVVLVALTVVSFALTSESFAFNHTIDYTFDAATCFENTSGGTEGLSKCGLDTTRDGSDPDEFRVYKEFPNAPNIIVGDNPQIWVTDENTGESWRDLSFYVKDGKIFINVGSADNGFIELDPKLTYTLTFEARPRPEQFPVVTVDGANF